MVSIGNVNSGGVFRADYTKNKVAVEPLPALEASPAAADEKVQEQSGNPLSGNSSSTANSESKDNTLSRDKQASATESLNDEGAETLWLSKYIRRAREKVYKNAERCEAGLNHLEPSVKYRINFVSLHDPWKESPR